MRKKWENYLNSLTLVEKNSKEFENLKAFLLGYSILVFLCQVTENIFFYFKVFHSYIVINAFYILGSC